MVERHSASLVAEKNKLKEDAARLLTQKANAERAIDAYRLLHDAEQRYEQLVQQHGRWKQESAKLNQTCQQLVGAIAQSKSDLTRAQSMGAVRKFFSGLNEEKLRQAIAASQSQFTSLQNSTSSCEQRIQECIKNGASVQKEIDSNKNRLKSVPPEPDCKQRLGQINARLSEHEAQIKAIDDELASIRQQLVAKCRVLATTVYQTYLKPELSRSFDVVIVDEASMLPLPMVFYSAGKATNRVIIAGDFRQLPPIVVSDDELCQTWLKTDVFHHAGIAKAVNAGREPPTLVTLREQFRMQDDLCGLVNRIFYDNQLRTSPTVRDRVSRRPFPSQQGLLFVDTSLWQPWASCRLGSFSRYNVLHALLIRNIVRRLASEGYLGKTGEVNDRLGVVSPFTAQCRLLAQLIGEVLNTRGSLYAATVHRFQGNERDAMICDITDSIGCRLSKFAKATQIDEDGARLLNVAMSRGRLCTVIVANFQFLESKLSEDSYLRRILDHFKSSGAPLDVENCIPFDAASILSAERLATGAIDLDADVDGLAAFREGTFFQAFRADCTNAEREIVLFSPYMTERGTSRWIDLWRAKLSQGVRIRIVIRPPGDQGGSLEHGLEELIESVRALGIAVDMRARMHEKMAFVDRRWLWHGSLNILSHRDTSESMLRLDSPAACEQVGRFVISDTAQQYRDFDLANGENPKCECGRPMIWNNGRFGVWFECECGQKANATGKSRQSTRRPSPQQKPGQKPGGKSEESKPLGDCPQCGKPLKSRTGRRGPFIGCTGYPHCRYTANLK